jgi:D-galactarolactone cycloisomerase
MTIALWDIAGKPLCALLGGARRAHVPAYASLVRYADSALVARNAKDSTQSVVTGA